MTAAIDLDRATIRGLHSALVDYLIDQPEWWRDSITARMGGLDHSRFVLALQARVLLVAAEVDEDGTVLVGLALPGDGQHDHLLLAIHGKDVGLDADRVLAAGELRLDEELQSILDEDER